MAKMFEVWCNVTSHVKIIMAAVYLQCNQAQKLIQSKGDKHLTRNIKNIAYMTFQMNKHCCHIMEKNIF